MKNTFNPTPLLQLDWLQGVIEHKGFPNMQFASKYRPVKLNIKGKIFMQVWNIYESATHICTISFQPNSPILPADLVSIKFSNGFLYCTNLKERVINFFNENNIVLKYWSRIDIAHDFLTFYNKLLPNNLIKRTKRDIYLKCGYSKSSTIDTQIKFTEYQYIRYGSYNCDVSVKLYNKTMEMQQKEWKKHIANSWEKCGFHYDDTVWRLEFNINNCRKYYLNKDTGEIFNLNDIDILEPYNVALLFNYLTIKYFSFKINNYKANKSRMKYLKIMELINWDENLIEFESVAQAGKCDKIAAKVMYEHNKNVREFTHPNENHFIYVLRQFLKDKGLTKWGIEKGYITKDYGDIRDFE